MNAVASKSNLTEKELTILASEMEKRAKKPLIAWLLWWFLGTLGGHKFYLGQTNAGIAYLVVGILSYATLIIIIGFLGLLVIGILWLIDAFTMQTKLADANEHTESQIINEILATRI